VLIKRFVNKLRFYLCDDASFETLGAGLEIPDDSTVTFGCIGDKINGAK